MDLKITLEQALEKASPRLREKMQHSIELVRKSERLALKYDQEKGFAVGYSGGKDSQAVYHIMQLAGVKFWAQFSPTSVDPPEVIRFIKKEYPEVEFRKLKTNIFKRAVEMGCLPTMRIRWCCAEFKENAFPGKVTVVGVRRAESAKRANRNEVEVTSHKYSGDLEGFDLWSEKQRERIAKKIKNLNQDQFAEPQGESTIRCVGGQDNIIIMPILHWTDDDVWEFLNKVVEVPHCSLYDEGRKRIGCVMCPFSSAKNTHADIKRWPHVYWRWVDVVRQLREKRPDTGGYGVQPPKSGGRTSTRHQRSGDSPANSTPPPQHCQRRRTTESGTDCWSRREDTRDRGSDTRPLPPNYYRKQFQTLSEICPAERQVQPNGDRAAQDTAAATNGRGRSQTKHIYSKWGGLYNDALFTQPDGDGLYKYPRGTHHSLVDFKAAI